MQLRDLLPWRTFDITTCWSPEVAIVELKKRVDKGGMLFGGTGTAPFVGRVRGTSEFELRRRIRGQNAFLPNIRVVVEPWHRGGARLGVTMRLHAFVALFMAVWMTGATVGALAVLPAIIAGNAALLPWLAFPLFGVGIVGISFALEASKAENLLRAIYVDAPALPVAPETGRAYH
ncbi:hypothetical protein AKJ09_05858 [Labilithrix luteola]|uniref:Uncharacterized protein n=1 Tax=Labilithrix luteola TaxID=1391654 RepID=A0A0K1Q1B4_9BACT|nr:hypothetical protein [Labilithrix luteola]AKU99194.1 hypothetical protein AKJ09_05858 [Labilithrix luteola]